MSTLPKVAVISFTDIQRDARVLRQLDALSHDYAVTFIGYGTLPQRLQEQVSILPVISPTSLSRRLRKLFYLPLGHLLSRFYEWWYASEAEYQIAGDLLRQLRPAVIHANDWESLPIAITVAAEIGAQVVSDLHEFAPAIKSESVYWRWFYKPLIEHFLRKDIHKAAAHITVCETVAERYQQEFAFHPTVVMNIPAYQTEISYKPCDPNHIHLVHHGNAMRNRFLERTIQTIALTDARFHLHFMLVARNKGYIEELQQLAERLAPGRVTFHEPVAPQEIVGKIAAFDMGIFLLPGVNFNYAAALPNKFFEFIHAGLAVCTGPSLEMARIASDYGLGLVTPSFEPEAVAQELNQLQPQQINEMKQQAIAATAVLNVAHEMQKLRALYQTVLEWPL